MNVLPEELKDKNGAGSQKFRGMILYQKQS